MYFYYGKFVKKNCVRTKLILRLVVYNKTYVSVVWLQWKEISVPPVHPIFLPISGEQVPVCR